MVRISAIFIAICMVLVAGSIGAVLFLLLHVSAALSGLAALAVLTVMALYNTITTRLRDRGELGDQIADLSRGTADLARQVGELSRKNSTLEQRLENSLTRARGASDPLAAEIGELGSLVKQLADTVAAHETEIYRRGGMTGGSAAVLNLPETATAAAAPPAAALDNPDAQAQQPADNVPAGRGFAGLPRNAVGDLIANAVELGRVDLYLQPIVTLPQRKVRFYEAMSRLRTEQGDVVPASDFIEYAEIAGLMPKIDNLLLVRCVQVVRRLQLKNREVGLFCNISPTTLSNAESFRHFLEFADANRALASSLVFEFSQRAYRNFGAIEYEALAALAAQGFRFSMDQVADLRLEPRELHDRSFRFLKVPAKLLLGRAAGQTDIHPADLTDLLARAGIDLVADRIESESMVVDLLDFDVRFGQGFLFSPPRPVRPEALNMTTETDAPVGQGTPAKAELLGVSGGA